MREDLTTRLGAGHVYQLQALADTDKAAALVAHAVGRGFELKREVAEYLVTRFARDMGSLVTVLDQLDQFSLESQRPVTLPLVRAAVAARAAH
jgi:DnaA family protein